VNFVLSFPIAVLSQYFFGTIIFVLSLFMVLLILVQRGKGGGLTGALGGPGGQSAFGTKAGDLFTRITIVAAAVWIFLLAFCTWWYTESDFSAALADDTVVGASPMMAAPSVPSTPGDATMTPAAPTSESPADPTAKASGEVEAGDMPKSAEAPTKDAGPSEPESAKPTEPTKDSAPTKEPEAAKPADKTETIAPKSDAPSSDEPTSPSKPPELTPPEPTSGEPK
jgi:preprotein translocase subunit SecG